MAAVVEFVESAVETVSNVVSSTIEAVGDVVESAVEFVSDVVEKVGNVVQTVIDDPLPVLLSIAGAAVGIPPYVTSSVITAAKGGNLEDVAKSAAISYATTSFMSDTQIGADIKNYTTNQWAGDFTDSMMEKFDLSADQAVQISRVASSSFSAIPK